MCRLWLGELEVVQGLPIRITIHHDTIDHHKLEFVEIIKRVIPMTFNKSSKRIIE
jgi:hypothetical protein